MTDKAGQTAEAKDTNRRELMPMDPQLKDIQPGGGVIIHLEQAWGAVRRCWWCKKTGGPGCKSWICVLEQITKTPGVVLGGSREQIFCDQKTACHGRRSIQNAVVIGVYKY